MDLQASLKGDNVRILNLAQLLEDTSVREPARRDELLYELTAEVEAHNRAEERVLFPLFLADKEAHEAIIQAQEENHANETVLEELHQMSKTDENFDHKARVLSAALRQHADFERDHVLARLPSFLDEEQLEALARQIEREKQIARDRVHDRY